MKNARFYKQNPIAWVLLFLLIAVKMPGTSYNREQ